MNTSRYAVVRRLSRVLLLPLHTQGNINDHNNLRRVGKSSSKSADQRCCTKENCLTCCKKFTAFMFSRVGLFFVMIGYVAVGGWLFQALEAGNEQNMRRSMSLELNKTLYHLWGEILRVNSYPYADKKGNFTEFATKELEEFETTVIKQVHQGFDGRTRTDADTDWNYFGAILYAVTLVSTIGYGHITTKTTPGKIATILYSAFGVPLMMLFVANIGSTMAKMFAFVFSRITMIFCCRWKKKRKRSHPKLSPKPIDIVPKSNLKRTKTPEEIEKISSTDLAPVVKERTTKLRFEDEVEVLPADVRLDLLTKVPSSNEQTRSRSALTRINELIRDNSLQIDDIDVITPIDSEPIQEKIEVTVTENETQQQNDEEQTSIKPTSEKISRRRFFSKKIKKQNAIEETLPPAPPDYEESTISWDPSQIHHIGNSDDDDDDEEDEQATVPLLVTVFVIPLYLTLGAILFNIWENWGFLNSFYFCFITLTTIGFGDFVPGSSLTVSAAKEKLISAALYILIGLVLLAMCFNLVKEQVTQKFKQVAGKWSMTDF